ncbi:MAG: M20 family metallo-hydrolase [Ginsengibacter sp.]
MIETKDIDVLTAEAIALLKILISTPAFSTAEGKRAKELQTFFAYKDIPTQRHINNVWVTNLHFDDSRYTLLLNSHLDTVKPNTGYTLNPFNPLVKEDKLYGLGSNDAGGALVSLLATFLYFYNDQLPFNIIYSATAEEEISGADGIQSLLPFLPKINAAIVGEPTKMNVAIAEKGLVVLDCKAKGKSGHAARDEGINAITIAMNDIQKINQLVFDKKSEWLGGVHVAVTSIFTPNKAHNVVPDECNFTVDVRVNEMYTLEEVVQVIKSNIQSTVTSRSFRLKSSSINENHELVIAAKKTGLQHYGSPTLSDMALMNFPAIKLGPGDSARSHTADEYIFLEEISAGIKTYIELIKNISI